MNVLDAEGVVIAVGDGTYDIECWIADMHIVAQIGMIGPAATDHDLQAQAAYIRVGRRVRILVNDDMPHATICIHDVESPL